MKYLNFYECSCGNNWTDEYDREVDDECSECNTSISPIKCVPMQDVVYLCGKCLSVIGDANDGGGECLFCGADDWIEKSDFTEYFTELKEGLQRIADLHNTTIETLKTIFI